MGIFDALQNMSPDQAQALMSAGAQVLQQSGDQRVPFGLGQAVGSGISAFQGSLTAAQRRKMEADQQAQLQQIRAMQIRDAQSDYANQEALRARANNLTAFRSTLTGPAPSAAPDAQQSGGQMPGPGQGQAPSAQAIGAGAPPMSAPTGAPPQQQGIGGGQGGMRQIISAQRLAEAQRYRQAGFIPEADAMEKQALDLQPKIKSWEKVMHDGKAMFAPYFEDGSSGAPVPLEVAEKLDKVNRGGTTDMVHPYTGAIVTSMKNTQSPDAAAALAQSERHFQQERDTPTYMDTSEGVVALPKRLAKGQVPTATQVLDANGNKIEKKANVPQYAVEGIIGNSESLASVNAAIDSLNSPGGSDAVGLKGYLPNTFLNRMYPEGTVTRANIADVGSLKLHDRSGAAVTASEAPRLMPFIPLPTDDAKTAKAKLIRFKQALEAETNNLVFQFPQAKKLAEEAAKNGQRPIPGSSSGGASGDWQSDGAAGAPQVIDFGSLQNGR